MYANIKIPSTKMFTTEIANPQGPHLVFSKKTEETAGCSRWRCCETSWLRQNLPRWMLIPVVPWPNQIPSWEGEEKTDEALAQNGLGRCCFFLYFFCSHRIHRTGILTYTFTFTIKKSTIHGSVKYTRRGFEAVFTELT